MKLSHILLLALLLISYENFAQAKRVKFKDEYVHSATNTVFPKTLYDYTLAEVNAFDKKKQEVCVEYKSSNSEDNTKLSIYLYPAYSGSEGRLRNEYLTALTAINYLSGSKREYQFTHTKVEGENYIVNGLKTSFVDDVGNNSELSIYECGTWFLKIRITSGKLTSLQIDNLEKEIIKAYSPTKFTALKPLNLRGKVAVSKLAYRDSLFLASSLACSFKKCEWANKNTSEKERKSGFPDLYLKMHMESIKQFIDLGEIGKNVKMKRTEATGKLINSIKSLIAAGYLDEYIMEAYQKIMIVPDDIVLDYNGYDKWKENNAVPEFLFPESVQVSYEDE